ncbi:MAG: hypothetical protein LBH64_04180, partial [Coriobacteriales bacterium]|nr:hypothetical protein [Coriobacteriales bacterium]
MKEQYRAKKAPTKATTFLLAISLAISLAVSAVLLPGCSMPQAAAAPQALEMDDAEVMADIPQGTDRRVRPAGSYRVDEDSINIGS